MCEHTQGHDVVEVLKSQPTAQLQCVAVCCSVLQCTYDHITGPNVVDLLKSQVAAQLQCAAVCCSVLQSVAEHVFYHHCRGYVW